ncbi:MULTISPECIES: ClpP family protease [Gordonia]|uniref:ATP-dependent Clp protease proteolytic subunit n=2 Tax=Gordonia TaxID=2053 RepID=L7LP21_9ACTN|nr:MULTISPECIES: ATP-dependent Clp protease proteolytic subunit [Gordonia]AUH68045.1 ATP-dependent Clp protease proteolytic subunit [Gordonia sp. YC-JH1]KJR09193.1 Clp protease ClpP [Gordonia sihwensis]KXT58903.1 Clp protease ClpP [Gordonia sp. QH-12]MBY4569312.1 ATP-dependent Clp protease proteolytic subunit [Gordonia sihwensis]WFN92226.1 ATP-dependent Clp protease proteolytic subunit [Gordonia sihwensis]
MSSYPIPNVVERTPAGERFTDVYSHLLASRIVYLGTPIDAGVANALVAQLIYLEADNPDRDIELYINCEGGDPAAMLAIYDTMQYIRPPVATTCVGQAVSVGAVLLAAGAPGKRSATPHSRLVLHQPAAEGRGTIPDLIIQADELVRVRSQMERILARHTGHDEAELRADTDHTRVFTAADAVGYGLIDQVVDER